MEGVKVKLLYEFLKKIKELSSEQELLIDVRMGDFKIDRKQKAQKSKSAGKAKSLIMKGSVITSAKVLSKNKKN